MMEPPDLLDDVDDHYDAMARRGPPPPGHPPGPPPPPGIPPFGGRVPPMPPFGGPPFRGNRRARRGDVRMALLALLAEKPMHGYEMLRELEQRSGSMWRPSAGSIYPTLQLLEDEGLIKGKDVNERRMYSITDTGRSELKSRTRERGEMPWDDPRDDRPRELHEAAVAVGEAALQVARVGTANQLERAVALLHETRRKIYALLAETP